MAVNFARYIYDNIMFMVKLLLCKIASNSHRVGMSKAVIMNHMCVRVCACVCVSPKAIHVCV